MQIGGSVFIKNRMANSVDPDEMAHYELSYLDLHCWQNRSILLKGLKRQKILNKLVHTDIRTR